MNNGGSYVDGKLVQCTKPAKQRTHSEKIKANQPQIKESKAETKKVKNDEI